MDFFVEGIIGIIDLLIELIELIDLVDLLENEKLVEIYIFMIVFFLIGKI